MFKLIVIFAVFVNTCHGDTSETDWRSRGWYRPRRNYPQGQGQNAFGINTSYIQNTDSQKPVTGSPSFGSSNYQRQTQNPGSFGQAQAQNTFGTSYNRAEQNSFGRQNSQSASFGVSTFGARSSGSVENGFNSNAQNRKSFGSSFSQNSKADYAQNTQSQNSFGSGYNQPINQNSFSSSQNQKSFGNIYTQNNQNQNAFGANYNQQTQTQNAFGYRQNSQTQNAFGSYNQNTQSQNSFGSFAQNQFKNSFGSASGQSVFKGPDYLPPNEKPKRPYIAPEYLPSKDPITTTKRPYYTTTTTRRPFYTTTTTRRPFYTPSTTTEGPKFGSANPGPAMAIPVPPEPEDDDGSLLIPDRSQPPGKVLPAMAMRVPPEPEDDDGGTLIPDRSKPPGQSQPAMAMAVPPEPEDDPTPPPTITTPPPTASTPPPTTTTPPPTTTTPPPTTPPPTTPPPTTTTPQPTTTTPPPTTTTPPPTTTTPPPTTTTPQPTTTTPPPTTTTPPPTTTTPPPTTTPLPTTTTPPPTPTIPTASTTTPNPDRVLIEETPKTTTPLPTDPYKAPEYLPPKNTTLPSLPPKPALALPVPPEPECDPQDPSTYPYPQDIDQRSFGGDPCTFVPVRSTTKKPFMAPAYLPPAVNTRVGRSAKTLRLEDVPGARPVWHVGLYTKNSRPYRQICGGSIVRLDVVITAAHCVWSDDTLLEPAEDYAVGANKIYRPWSEPHDKRAQQSDVREIIVPPRYRGGKTSFQDDIALLKLVTPFTYARGLRPVCINFDDDFDAEQLSEGNSGTVAGWGYTDEVGSHTQTLLWLELPYVPIEQCVAGADDAFLKYITSDKICAGEYHTGKALCKGDSGGGLIFWHGEGDVITPYLRGVASASARADNKECNVDVVGGFTQITAHRRFLLRHIPEVDLNCRYHDTDEKHLIFRRIMI